MTVKSPAGVVPAGLFLIFPAWHCQAFLRRADRAEQARIIQLLESAGSLSLRGLTAGKNAGAEISFGPRRRRAV